MTPFEKEMAERLDAVKTDASQMEAAAHQFIEASFAKQYSYNFFWQGRPIIQYPQDIMAMQELIWDVKPDLIIETGIAHGGSLIFMASQLAQLELCEAIEAREVMDPAAPKRRILGIDIDIRAHNREAIEAHPMAGRIDMIEGSSIAPDIIKQVRAAAEGAKTVMISLDSNHTHDHVLAELEAYADLTSVDSYCVVFDTLVENMDASLFHDRPWGPGDNPRTAVNAFLQTNDDFEIDRNIDAKLQISVAPGGYLRRIK
ncbi:cephalosporin hydroxylase family protein [Gymnodinialimonas sp. 57CJ19]|uniref:cephalosporin hydroxylase family protein n=1 Tax=Gymnodinialimonas sp. 57CJ19 TaxID=3138498 RepID=UPI003134648F